MFIFAVYCLDRVRLAMQKKCFLVSEDRKLTREFLRSRGCSNEISIREVFVDILIENVRNLCYMLHENGRKMLCHCRRFEQKKVFFLFCLCIGGGCLLSMCRAG